MAREGITLKKPTKENSPVVSAPQVVQQPPVVAQKPFDQRALDDILELKNTFFKLNKYLDNKFATKNELLDVTSFTLGQIALQGNLFCKQFADEVECNDILAKFQQSMDCAGKDQTSEQHDGVD